MLGDERVCRADPPATCTYVSLYNTQTNQQWHSAIRPVAKPAIRHAPHDAQSQRVTRRAGRSRSPEGTYSKEKQRDREGQAGARGENQRGAGETFNLIVPVRRMYDWAKEVGILWALDESVAVPPLEEILKMPVEGGNGKSISTKKKSSSGDGEFKFLIRRLKPDVTPF